MPTSVFSILTTFVLALSLSACVGSGAKIISESDKDISGIYDGLWDVRVHKHPALQYIQNWQMSCGDMRHETNLLISNGEVVSISGSNDSDSRTYVSQSGQFSYVEGLDQKAEASGISDVSMDNGSAKLIFNGKLSETSGKGYLTIGIAQFGYDGCKAKVSFTKRA